jgi:hypothetical protein
MLSVCSVFCFNRVSAAAPTFATGVTNGFVNTYDISEASGIIVSRQNPGVLWTHNDSGYRGSIMALTTNGTYLARHYVPDVYSGNFEDISFGPGPIPQHQYIYLGDIGDNFLSRPNVRVLRFPEPAVYDFQSNAPVVAPIFGAEEIVLTYPDGPWDSEAMVVDPLSGDLFLLTKQTNSSRIYRATRAELNSGSPVALTFMREITFQKVSGADVSADGLLIALRRQNKGGLWVRTASQSVSDALAGSASTIPVIGDAGGEFNGEAIGFDPTASSYYTISEGYLQPICYFARTSTLPTPPRVFIAPGSDWHILDTGAAPPANWRIVTNDTWRVGPAPLGYGGNERTVLAYGNSSDKYPATYFRKTFSASSLIQSNLALRICFNDGVAVYLNGTEILRRNLGANAVSNSYATAPNTDQWRTWFTYPVTNSLLRVGTNVLAVELHRADATGSLLNFDLQLVEARVDAAPRVSSVRRIGTNCIVTVTGPTNLVARIERSTDSQSWIFDRQLLLSNGSATFTNPFTPPRSYFRVAP